MNKINYQKELDDILKNLKKDPQKKTAPLLLLHACCAPCSSYVLEYLSNYFRIVILFYNPNITPKEEYGKRVEELKRLLKEANYGDRISLMEGPYDPETFFETTKGMEDLPERSIRCYHCYGLRMREAASCAAKIHADYFTTTLSISPHKNAQWINEIGTALAKEYGVSHLPSDFKKRGGYLRSIALSEEYHLYRQNYCGCIFSRRACKTQSPT